MALTRFNSFAQAVAEKKHNLTSDTFKVVLCDAAHAPVATNTVLANLTTVATTNLSTLTLAQAATPGTTGAIYRMTFTDLLLTSTGGPTGPFRYAAIYNDTAANDDLVAFRDYGAEITLADTESILLDFPAVTIPIGE